MDFEDRKAARETQWREAPQRPIAAKPMQISEIEHYRKLLVQSYQCDDQDIRMCFIKIVDSNDEDRDDMIWLKYLMKTVAANGDIVDRPIYSLKLPIPDHIKARANDLRKERTATGSRRRRTHKTLPSPQDANHGPAVQPQAGAPPSAPRSRPVPRGYQRGGPQTFM